MDKYSFVDVNPAIGDGGIDRAASAELDGAGSGGEPECVLEAK
jgi:hypothetical protein